MKSISSRFGKKKKVFVVICSLLLFPIMKAERPTGSKRFSLFDLDPFERAVICIKYYEGMHRQEQYPYVGYGHKLKPGENYSSEMTKEDAEILLRKDLRRFCSMFRSYGKDSILLGTLAYNVGPYTLLGSKTAGIEKSELLRKLESGDRNIEQEYLQYCHWNGNYVSSIAKRRYFELLLLYTK